MLDVLFAKELIPFNAKMVSGDIELKIKEEYRWFKEDYESLVKEYGSYEDGSNFIQHCCYSMVKAAKEDLGKSDEKEIIRRIKIYGELFRHHIPYVNLSNVVTEEKFLDKLRERKEATPLAIHTFLRKFLFKNDQDNVPEQLFTTKAYFSWFKEAIGRKTFSKEQLSLIAFGLIPGLLDIEKPTIIANNNCYPGSISYIDFLNDAISLVELLKELEEIEFEY